MTPSIKVSNRKKWDTAICPLCGGPNQCAVAADPNATECWCESVVFPDELLARIPQEAIRKTCVCQTCLREYRESSVDAESHLSSE